MSDDITDLVPVLVLSSQHTSNLGTYIVCVSLPKNFNDPKFSPDISSV